MKFLMRISQILLPIKDYMTKIKVMTILGTRPEIIRLSSILKKFEIYFDHKLVHTGQNYDFELNEIFFQDLGIKPPDYYLNAAGSNATQTISNVISSVDILLEKDRPDAILILGDTNSAMAALAAKKKKIPIFHYEAGNRCFDARVPEETNRRLIDHVADINLTYSTIARESLLREGLAADRIIKIGSPMREVINSNLNKINVSVVLKRLNIEEGKYFLFSSHREENIDSQINFNKILNILSSIGDFYSLPIIFSAHPRTLMKLKSSAAIENKYLKILKPLNFTDYVRLQLSAKAVISDSGTISEESSLLNFRAINLRESHERPEAMEEGSVMMTGLSWDRIHQALQILEFQPQGKERILEIVNDYKADNISEKLPRIILSYIDYINTNTWKV